MEHQASVASKGHLGLVGAPEHLHASDSAGSFEKLQSVSVNAQ